MNNRPVSVGELYDFVQTNKGHTTFMGYTDEEVAGLLLEGAENGTLFYKLSDDKIVGMILASKDDKNKSLFVTENLAMSISTLKEFARKAKSMWPEYKLEAIRHGQVRHFNTPKLYNKLTANTNNQ